MEAEEQVDTPLAHLAGPAVREVVGVGSSEGVGAADGGADVPRACEVGPAVREVLGEELPEGVRAADSGAEVPRAPRALAAEEGVPGQGIAERALAEALPSEGVPAEAMNFLVAELLDPGKIELSAGLGVGPAPAHVAGSRRRVAFRPVTHLAPRGLPSRQHHAMYRAR